MSRYLNSAMKAFAEQQIRFAPVAVRIAQLEECEKLILDLDLEARYRYETVCEFITGYRSAETSWPEISGAELMHDLRCLIEDLSSSLKISAESVREPVLTVDEVSQRLNISPKTVGRWRDRGLPSRWFVINGRKRLGVKESSLQRFIHLHPDEVNRGRSVRPMSISEREQVICAARRLASEGRNLTEISRELGIQFQRSTETIRTILRNFDALCPENAVFPVERAVVGDPRMSMEHKELAAEFARQGVSIAEIARRFGRSKAVICASLAEMRAIRLKSLVVDFIDNPEFQRDDAESRIVSNLPTELPSATAQAPSGLPSYLTELYEVPLLTREEEQHFFRLMNFLKYRFVQLQKSLNPAKPVARLATEMEGLLEQIAQVKNHLIRSNLRLVVSIAKRHLRPGSNFFELVSDGNMSLIRAVEKFDYARGNKFSTYASWAIMKNFARSVPAENARMDRYRTGEDDVFSQSPDQRSDAVADVRRHLDQQTAIQIMMQELDGREQAVISCRFGLNQNAEPETLEQVGQRLGVTKERVRQIEVRTLEKLRRIAERRCVEIPGI